MILDQHENCETCLDVLQGLENIDDDAQRQNIALVKTVDAEFAESIGISEFPALVFYKDGTPNLFDGDITAEEEVLGMFSHKMSIITIFSHKYFEQNLEFISQILN